MADRLNMANDSITDLDGSDIVHESPCKPCSDEDTNTEGVCICFQCQTCFCERCVGHHNKCFKTHSLFYKTSTKSQNVQQTSDLMCERHPGNVIQMFCGEHDLVTCAVCIAMDHRLCKGVDYIPKLTKEILNGRDRKDIRTSLENLKEDLKAARASKVEEIDRVISEKESNLNEIRTVTERIIARVKKLEETSVKEVQGQYDSIVDVIRTEIKSLDEMSSSTETHIKKIDQYKGNNEAKLFVLLNKANDRESECRKYLEGDDKVCKDLNAKMSFQINHDIESALDTVESLVFSESAKFDVPGYKKTLKVCELSLVAEFNVKANSHQKVCSINDFCILDDGGMLIVDTSNQQLKRLDQGLNLKDVLNVPLSCKGLCKTGPREFAYVCGPTVQFVYVGRSLINSRSFQISAEKMRLDIEGYYQTGQNLEFILFSKDKLFILVRCSYRNTETEDLSFLYKSAYMILLCDVEGCHLQTIFTDPSCSNQTFVNHFSFSQDGTSMFIAMSDKGLIKLNRNGQVLFEVTDERLRNAYHVSEVDNSQIYVCGRDSGNIFLVDKDGKVVKEVLGRYDGLGSPISCMFIRDQKRLLVACANEDSVKIFQM